MENIQLEPGQENLTRGKRGRGARPILETQIRAVQEQAKSAAEAARTLNVTYNTYKKYAKLYGLFDKLKNPKGIGITRKKHIRDRIYKIEDIIAGQHLDYPLVKYKKKLFDSGYLPCICGSCGFSEARITDGKYPLMLDFIDGNMANRKLENIRALCYNCFFLLIGDRNHKKWYEIKGISEETIIENNKQKYADDLVK